MATKMAESCLLWRSCAEV